MRLKSIFYDWGGVNEALLLLFQPASAVAWWLAWIVSAVGSYWVAPLVLSAMAWRVSRARDARQAGLLGCQIRRFILAGMAASVLTWLLKGALNLPRPFSILGVAVSPVGAERSFGLRRRARRNAVAPSFGAEAIRAHGFRDRGRMVTARARHALPGRRGRWLAAWRRLCRAVPAPTCRQL